MDDEKQLNAELSGSRDSSLSELSSVSHSPPWWRSPERMAAVVGACVLRYLEKIGPYEVTAVFITAVGGPMALSLWRRLRDRGRNS